MDYSINTKQQMIVLDIASNPVELEVSRTQHSISMSRTGGQGSQGASVASATMVAGELVLTMSDGRIVNAGNIIDSISGDTPTDLNTLEKLADAINNDPNFFQTLRPIAYSGSLSDVETGNLTVGSVTGGSY